MASTMVSTTEAIADMLITLTSLPTSSPSLFLDLEGVKLSREGSISIMQIFAKPNNHVYLVDIHTLGAAAFSTPATAGGTTLKTLLEDITIPKVFFDVRNDSDALFFRYQIELRDVEDVQLIGERHTADGFQKVPEWAKEVHRGRRADQRCGKAGLEFNQGQRRDAISSGKRLQLYSVQCEAFGA